MSNRPILIIFALTIFSILINGYQFGELDHAIEVPFLKEYHNPSLYPDDILMTTMPYYYTYLWRFLAPFIEYIDIEILFFSIFLPLHFFTYFMIYKLTLLLFKDERVAFVSLLLLLIPKVSIGGIMTHDLLLINRSFVLPFLLLSIYYFLKERYANAFLLCGVMFNFHAMSSSFVFFMFLVSFIRQKSVDLRPLFLFFISASPLLIWIIKSASFGVAADGAWLEIIRGRSSGHLFPLSWSFQKWFLNLMIPVFFILSLKYKPEKELHRKILSFFAAILLLCLVGTIFAEFIPVSTIIKFHMLRSSKFFIILAIIYISNYFVRSLKGPDFTKKIALYGAACAIFFNVYPLVLPFFLLLLSLEFKSRPDIFRGLLAASGLFTFAVFLSLVTQTPYLDFLNIGSLKLGWFRLAGFFFGISMIYVLEVSGKVRSSKAGISYLLIVLAIMSAAGVYVRSTSVSDQMMDWKDLQLWSKDNTPIDSMIIVPPYYLNGFRVYSERSIYVDWKDGGQAIFGVDFALEWKKRMEELKDYNSLTEDDFGKISQNYNNNFVVVEKPKELNFKQVYENNHYRIYEINRDEEL